MPVTDPRDGAGHSPERLGPSLDETTIEDINPAAIQRARRRGERLLDVRGLRTSLLHPRRRLRAVDGIDFHVDRGENHGARRESGCGKSVTSLSIMRLIAPAGRTEAGVVVFDGQDLLKLDTGAMRKIRGNRISMIFQQPQSSLNPVGTSQADRRGARAAPQHEPQGGAQPGHRAAQDGRHPGPGAARAGVPARASGGTGARGG